MEREILGRVWKFGENINTDLMMPTTVFSMPPNQQKNYVFEAIRPGWSKLVHEGDMIVGGGNFGTGSSRPGSRLLRELGIVAVLADSMNGLFFRNCINYGVVPIVCPGVTELFDEGDEAGITPQTSQVRNRSRDDSPVMSGRLVPEKLMTMALTGGVRALLEREGFFKGDK